MKFLRLKINNEIKSAVEQDNKIYTFENILGENIELIDFVKNYDEKEIIKIKDGIARGIALELSEVEILAPFEEPIRNVICLGKNYLEHVSECDTGGIDKNLGRPAHPIFFSKMVNKFVAVGKDIELHEGLTSALDYEGELAVIIGKECKDISPQEVEEHIFGYSIINDTSARDLQRQHTQWLRGKSLDNTTAFGPCILHKNEIAFPPKLKIETRINGELRQSNYTDNLIFDIAYCISLLSKGTTLKKGDIIATGTPAGVGMGFDPPKVLKDGDLIEIEIEKIGVLSNKLKK
jgi:2-keto-4-pentenoate hydratase/2-oxohepta-3-ene-1,7-dioic acid hydratase in catechol pathway